VGELAENLAGKVAVGIHGVALGAAAVGSARTGQSTGVALRQRDPAPAACGEDSSVRTGAVVHAVDGAAASL